MSPEYLAFSGEFEVVSAEWSLANGRTATFRICGNAFGRNHPFKKFQQRRGGRVGTRFRASCVGVGSAESINLELMLCAWKDSSTIGQTVTFWLDDDSALHPFAGCAYRKGQEIGDIFAVAIVELTDDDKPVRQEQARAADGHGPRPDHPRGAEDAEGRSAVPGGGAPGSGDPGERPSRSSRGAGGARGGRGVPAKNSRLSSLAHRTVTGPSFIQFLKETKPHLIANWTPELAKVYAKNLIKVESLADLDRDAAAAERFRQCIGRPFDCWRWQYPL